MNDEELERLLRDSNPATTPADAPLSMRQRATMESIIAEQPARARQRSQLALLITAPAAAMIAIFVLLVAVLQPLGSSPATAYGPAPLTYHPTGQTPQEVVEVAHQQLLAGPGASSPSRYALSTAWNLSVNDDGTAAPDVVISPLVTELSWSEDLSGNLRVRAGRPYLADGSGNAVPEEERVEPGTVLDDRAFGPGEFPAQIPDESDLEPARLPELLQLLAPDPKRPGDAFLGMHAVLNEWTLTNAQHDALIRALLAYDNIAVRGTATDRLGREVIGLDGMSSRAGQRVTILISASTGRIVGVETTVVQDDDLLAVPAGTVISYTLWKDSK